MQKTNFSDFAKNPPKTEEEVLAFWRENKIFERVLKKTKKRKPFHFFEGPPYANGRPGIHHVLARVFKDIILRYKTMRGFYVERKAGWDTQGLPTEIEAEKILGVSTKKEIEEQVGLEKFIATAKKNVFHYKEEWEKLTERIAYWLDLKNPYITMKNDYLESLWWVFQKIARRGFLYNDFKIIPWCSRCETILSHHELAQGYKETEDPSIFVKFPVAGKKTKTYLLVWTTTPWTLLSNVALAVNKKAVYLTIEKNGEWIVAAENKIHLIERPFKVILSQKGEGLVGLKYEPLYPDEAAKADPSAYKVYAGDFVNIEEGSGIVHIAPAFGEDDLNLGKAYNLPLIKRVLENGRIDHAGYIWHKKYFKDGNDFIIDDLEKRGLLYKKETYAHEYPFCWRCSSPLMYYAKKSWFFKTSALKKELIKANQEIEWHPPYIGKGRFGEWLKENKDWAISRERYFGTPLPIWRCEECGQNLIIGSLKELNQRKKNKTVFYFLRHGEADHNVSGMGGPVKKELDEKTHLTDKGKKQIKEISEKLKKEKIDLMFSSPMQRAQETAKIVSELLGIDFDVIPDLHDLNTGAYQGRQADEFNKEFPFWRKLKEAPEGGENLRKSRARMIKAIKDLDKKHKGKKILIISHGDPLWVANAAIEGKEEKDYPQSWYPRVGELKKIEFPNWPFNSEGELDLHRPYIDEIELDCPSCQKPIKRIKEVADVWYDSGAMPFASIHYPFAFKQNKKYMKQPKNYPADYICEGIDQTRGWFYTMLAVSLLAGFKAAYKRVLVVGLIMDPKGEKMSKSKGNIVLPADIIGKYGSEALRWHFFTVSNPWETKKFREEDVAKTTRRMLLIFWNSFLYYKTYKINNKISPPPKKAVLKINEWILAKLNGLNSSVSSSLDNFDIVPAAREMEQFVVDDLSRWYIRRIRPIMKSGGRKEKEETSNVLGFVLLVLTKLFSPFLPLLSERVFLDLRSSYDEASVHLEEWPKIKKPSKKEAKLIEEMSKIRSLVSLGLEERSIAGVKVRQPLSSAKIKEEFDEDLLKLLKDEINVKEILIDKNLKQKIKLDVKITKELKEDGIVREFVREIQSFRKKAGLLPKDKISLFIETNKEGEELLNSYKREIEKITGIKELRLSKIQEPEAEIKIENMRFLIKR